MQMNEQRQERIRERAHRLWEEEGRPEGRADAHWLAAEAMERETTEAALLDNVDAAVPAPEQQAAEPATPRADENPLRRKTRKAAQGD
jgi:hypothetical protein